MESGEREVSEVRLAGGVLQKQDKEGSVNNKSHSGGG